MSIQRWEDFDDSHTPQSAPNHRPQTVEATAKEQTNKYTSLGLLPCQFEHLLMSWELFVSIFVCSNLQLVYTMTLICFS